MSFVEDPEVWRSVLENLPAGVCAIDAAKKIVLWSDGAEEITGYKRYEVIGHSCVAETLLHCDQPGCEFCGETCPLACAMKSAQGTEAVGFMHHKAGHEIPVRLRAVPVRNAHGSIVGAVEIFENQQQAIPDNREESLNFPGCVDEETGVASHLMMQSHLRETLGTFAEVQVPFGVLCFRLEGIEHFRASFGPAAAKVLLGVAARTLEGSLWKTDFVGRWSDDQFLVILNGCREDGLGSVRERLRHMMANNAIEWWGERRSLPVFIGQAMAQAGDTIESLMARAQKSLDAASPAQSRSAAGGNPVSGS